MTEEHTYDLDLFRSLNAEYRERPLVPRPRNMNPSSLEEQARRRASSLDRRLSLRGRRVLEIGCGRGHLAAVLATEYGCEVVGVDIVEYETWPELAEVDGLRLTCHDVTAGDNDDLGRFDRILSLAVFEHVERPLHGLDAIGELLDPAGSAYLSANLYRGPKASHRYREVFFPFPHLLFADSVFADFYAPTRYPHVGPAWVNKLTGAHYREYVRSIGLAIDDQWTDRTELDRQFYERFVDKLGKYPIEDLEADFVHLVLSHDKRSGDRSIRSTAATLAKRAFSRAGRTIAKWKP